MAASSSAARPAAPAAAAAAAAFPAPFPGAVVVLWLEEEMTTTAPEAAAAAAAALPPSSLMTSGSTAKKSGSSNSSFSVSSSSTNAVVVGGGGGGVAMGGLDSGGLTGCGRFRLARRARAVDADFAGGVPWAAARAIDVVRGRMMTKCSPSFETKKKQNKGNGASLHSKLHFFQRQRIRWSNGPPRSLEERSFCSPIHVLRGMLHVHANALD